jgi:hypothetical protein
VQLLQCSCSLQTSIYTVEDRSESSYGLQGLTLVRRNVASEEVRAFVVVLRCEGGTAALKWADKNGIFLPPPGRHSAHGDATSRL